MSSSKRQLSVREEVRDIRTVLREEGHPPALPVRVAAEVLTRFGVKAPTWVGRAEISLSDVARNLLSGGYTAESLYVAIGDMRVSA